MQQPSAEDREQQHHRNHDQNNEGSAKTQKQQHEYRNCGCGNEQLEHQLVHFGIGGLPVVSGDGDLHIVRDDRPPEVFQLPKYAIGDGNAVAALFLGDGDGHCRRAVRRQIGLCPRHARVVLHEALNIPRTVDDLCDVADVYRAPLLDRDQNAADVFGITQKRAGAYGHGTRTDFNRPCRAFCIGGLQCLRNLVHRHVVPGQALWLHFDPDHFLAPADNKALARIRGLVQILERIQSNLAQHGIVDFVRPEREGDSGYIIHPLRLDHGLGDSGRHQVPVGSQSIMDLDDRRLHLLPDVKLHRDHGFATMRDGVHVIDPGYLAHEAFQRPRHQTGDLLGRNPRIRHKNVDHGYGDLRILLSRGDDQTQDTNGQCGKKQQRRERRMNKALGHPAREPQILFGRPCAV